MLKKVMITTVPLTFSYTASYHLAMLSVCLLILCIELTDVNEHVRAFKDELN